MEDNSVIFAILGAVVFLFLLYVVIRSAVSKETKETVKELKISNQLKYIELRKQGLSHEEITKELGKIN